jgi:hypothetical protein
MCEKVSGDAAYLHTLLEEILGTNDLRDLTFNEAKEYLKPRKLLVWPEGEDLHIF